MSGPGVPRAVVLRALDAIEDGDITYAADVLLNALEDGPSTAPQCGVCGVAAFPGDRARHIFSAHCQAEERRAA